MAQGRPRRETVPVRPAIQPENQQNQMIAMAEHLALEQLQNGTASSQIIHHYVKLAADKHKRELEEELLRTKIELEQAKIEAIKSAEQTEILYAEAIEAMRRYGGHGEDEEYYEP